MIREKFPVCLSWPWFVYPRSEYLLCWLLKCWLSTPASPHSSGNNANWWIDISKWISMFSIISDREGERDIKGSIKEIERFSDLRRWDGREAGPGRRRPKLEIWRLEQREQQTRAVTLISAVSPHQEPGVTQAGEMGLTGAVVAVNGKLRKRLRINPIISIFPVLFAFVACENQNVVELKKTVAALQDIKNYLHVMSFIIMFWWNGVILSGHRDTRGADAGADEH